MDASGELYSPGRREPAVSLLSSGESDGSSAAMHGVGHNSIYESVHVLVRVRPLSQLELTENQESVVDIVDKQSLTVTSSDGKKVFKCTYDSVLGMSSTQLDVYNVVRSCTESVLDGFNSTIFAYGQTGSGKVSKQCCSVDQVVNGVDICYHFYFYRPTPCTDLRVTRAILASFRAVGQQSAETALPSV